jgi:hypothetical protein
VRILSALALTVAIVAVPAPSSAQPVSLPTSGALFGAYVQPRAGQGAEAATAGLEATLHRKLDLVRIYRQWDDAQPDPVVAGAILRGRIPVLSIRPKQKDGRIVPWAAIARGDADAAIVRQADGLRSLQGTIFLSFHHEPDDVAAAGYGTPAEYVAAWRHYRQVFAQRGVGNVVFTWIMIPSSFRTPALADAFYPGDDAVDWIAEDAYNWYGCSSGKPPAWRSPTELIAPFAAWAQPHGKPLMLAEWGSVEDPAVPQRKAQWLRDMLAAARTWPQLKALSYFDASGSCYWRLDSSPAAQEAFADDSNDPSAHGRTSAYLAPSTALGVAPLTLHLDGSGSAGAGAATGAGISSWTLDFGDGSASVAGTGRPPADVTHSYPAGTYSVRLHVTDTAGGVNQDEWRITSAGAPVITGKIGDVTTVSATSYAWVAPQGYAATAYAEWGSTTAYGHKSLTVPMVATFSTAAVTFPLTGLTPGTHYNARVVATSAAGTAVRVWTFDTR